MVANGHNGCDFGRGVLSLTVDPTNILMWSHYAANHTGIVVRINPAKLDEYDRGSLLQVKYTNRYPRPTMASRYDESVPIEKLFGYKARQWSYEMEYRYISDRVGVVQFNPASIDAVIFGCRCPYETRNQLCEVIETRTESDHDVAIMHTEMVDGAFALRLEVDSTI